MKSLRDAIINALAGELVKPASDFSDASTWESLGADSLDVLGCLCAVQTATGAIVPAEAIDGLLTVGDLIRYVESLPMTGCDSATPV